MKKGMLVVMKEKNNKKFIIGTIVLIAIVAIVVAIVSVSSA